MFNFLGRIKQLELNQEKLFTMSTSTNAAIAKLQNDMNALATSLGAFITAVQASIAKLQAGNGGTTLSAADAADLAALDTQAETAQAAIAAVTLPQ
jgi:hypothetical protein